MLLHKKLISLTIIINVYIILLIRISTYLQFYWSIEFQYIKCIKIFFHSKFSIGLYLKESIWILITHLKARLAVWLRWRCLSGVGQHLCSHRGLCDPWPLASTALTQITVLWLSPSKAQAEAEWEIWAQISLFNMFSNFASQRPLRRVLFLFHRWEN